jgi:hypothetical protein
VGETRVDLLHLLEDLRDAYPGPAEETILTEIVANSLDSRASLIAITTDPGERTITLADDGTGMRRRELARYHDIAASTKVKGEGIGFAGVGIKIALLVSREVHTETRQRDKHVATVWALASRHRAPWKWVQPLGLVAVRGTAVRLTVDNALSPLLDPGFVEMTLRRHFQPLFDPGFRDLLGEHYSAGVTFRLNGEPLSAEGRSPGEVATIAVRLARRRKPSAMGYLIRERSPIPEDRRGLCVSTLGKVIKRGWDWIGLTPSDPLRVAGMVEVPPLAECLTLNKSDFTRSGPRGAMYLAYRKAIQEAISRPLAEWGSAGEMGDRPRRAARPAERDLEDVLMDLADAFPLLTTLVEQRAGGQRRLPTATSIRAGSTAAQGEEWTMGRGLDAYPAIEPASREPRVNEPSPSASRSEADASPSGSESATSPEPIPASVRGDISAHLPAQRGPRRPGRYGLTIQFEARPNDSELGRLIESTVWINEAHPAYRRAAASRSEGYHIAVAAALALAPLAVDPAKEHAFVAAFLESWGSSLTRRKTSVRSPRRRR